MEVEKLQAIWDTQNDKPVFAMQDPRLLVALYQQREHSRRWAFRLHFAPMYVAAVAMLSVIGALVATFRNIDSLMRRFEGRFTHNGFAMSAWDYAGLAIAVAALLALVAPLYLERKKHERTQEIFAPTLREELDRGIAQLDFAMRLDRTPRVLRILTLLSIVVVMISWEAQRAAGNPTPWWSLLGAVWVFLPGCLGWVASRKKEKQANNDGTEAGTPASAGIDACGSGRGSRQSYDENRKGYLTDNATRRRPFTHEDETLSQRPQRPQRPGKGRARWRPAPTR